MNEMKLLIEIKCLENRLESAKRAEEFWLAKEREERANPKVAGPSGYKYLHFLKQKRKQARADTQYFSEKLESEKLKLLFI